MRVSFAIRRLLAAAIGMLVPMVAVAQATETLRSHSASYDLAMGVHYGEPAGWSVALGAERYQPGNVNFLLVEPGRQADRISIGAGNQTSNDLTSALATNFRASFLRVRKPSARAAVGNYGGVEAQVLLWTIGARVGVFAPTVRGKRFVTIDASLGF